MGEAAVHGWAVWPTPRRTQASLTRQRPPLPAPKCQASLAAHPSTDSLLLRSLHNQAQSSELHSMTMKRKRIALYDKKTLVGAVNFARRKQLLAGEQDWVQFLAAQQPSSDDAAVTFHDPQRHSVERLVAFLAALSSQKLDPRQPPDSAVLKPQKLLKRLLPWLQKSHQDEQALSQAMMAHTGSSNKSSSRSSSSSQAGVWALVQRTRTHVRFKQRYEFPSYEKEWTRTDRLPLPERSQPLRLLALDCEMCETASDSKALLQVALLDQQGTVLLKALVQPPEPVTDYRSALTGITAADLTGVTDDRAAVAARVAALLTPGTVLVGHSLHYDLQALRLDHQPVIDTAMLFSYVGLASATPSLTHLAELLLGRTLRGADGSSVHDSVDDASAAMALVLRELSLESPTPPLVPPAIKVDKADQAKLCVHKLPPGATVDAVQASLAAALRGACDAGQAAAAAAAAVTAASAELDGSGKKQALLAFAHAGQANEVFSALPGKMFTDSWGRHSKTLQLQGTSHKVVVRKMVCHNGMAFGKDAKEDRGAKKQQPGTRKRKQQQGGGKPAKQQKQGSGKDAKKQAQQQQGKKKKKKASK